MQGRINKRVVWFMLVFTLFIIMTPLVLAREVTHDETMDQSFDENKKKGVTIQPNTDLELDSVKVGADVTATHVFVFWTANTSIVGVAPLSSAVADFSAQNIILGSGGDYDVMAGRHDTTLYNLNRSNVATSYPINRPEFDWTASITRTEANVSSADNQLSNIFSITVTNYTPPAIPVISNGTWNVTTAYFNDTNPIEWRTATTNNVVGGDSTPTVTFTTDVAANCSIGLSDFNYSGMVADDSNTHCSATGTTSHTCTLSTTIVTGKQ